MLCKYSLYIEFIILQSFQQLCIGVNRSPLGSPDEVILNIGCNKGLDSIAWLQRFDQQRFWKLRPRSDRISTCFQGGNFSQFLLTQIHQKVIW